MEIDRESLLDFDSLSNNDKARLHLVFLAPMGMHVTSIYLAAQEDLVDDAYAEAWLYYWVSFVRSPGISAWWDQTKAGYFQPEFVREIDRLRASPGGPPPYHEGMPWFAPDDRTRFVPVATL